jgi:zinc D-Ala-D-Ala carboxypeptidase
MSEMLSENFSLLEFTQNSRGIVNEPSPDVIKCLKWFATCFLEPIRKQFGPIKITSGFRGDVLNALVGGVKTSAHRADSGRCAADIQPMTEGVTVQQMFDWIRLESKLPVDQVILEYGKQERHAYDDCVHIGVRKDEPRKMALVGSTHGTSGYTQVEFKA